MDSRKWLARVSEDASVNAIAKSIGVSTSTLDSQLKSSTGLKPDTMVAIARAYGYSPVAALVDCGLVTELDARSAAAIERDLTVPSALAEATDDQLLREIGRRLDERGAGGELTSLTKPKRATPSVRKKSARQDKDPDA